MNKPYTGIEGNKIIGDLIHDINDILIDLKEEGWYINVNYVPKRWEGEIVKIKSDSISIALKNTGFDFLVTANNHSKRIDICSQSIRRYLTV